MARPPAKRYPTLNRGSREFGHGWLFKGKGVFGKVRDSVVLHFYYWHCSSRTRPCSQRDKIHMAKQGRKASYSEAEIEELLSQVFKPLKFTPDVCKWMQDVLLKEHREKSQHHKHTVAALRRRFEMLDHYMNEAYEDKLNGLIPETMWQAKHAQWRSEKEQVHKEIVAQDQQKDEYIQRGVQLIELVQHFETIYKNATPEKKRQMVEIVVSNLSLKYGKLEFTALRH